MATKGVISSGKQSFAPRARLVSVLGDQLIRDARVGLLELVKNSYDADASEVIVELHGLADPETTEIIITDDGYGMDKETVLGMWLEPATGHKEQAKKDKTRSPIFKRLPLGEKGVGRFATHRLGRQLELITRRQEQPEIVLRINWDDFDKANAYLSQIEVDWEERTPIFFSGKKTGARIVMHNARVAWTELDVRAVSEGLKRLMSPFKPSERLKLRGTSAKAIDDFRIRLVCPDFPKYQDLDPGDLLKQAHAKFEGYVDSNGVMYAEYSFDLPGFRSRQEVFNDVDLRVDLHKEKWGAVDRKPECGGFYFYFYIWHRTPSSLNLTGTNPKDLDKQSGVNIFRDGLRILPYGNEDDDWLSLDERRYLKPGKTIGRQSLIAAIELSQDENSQLRDKTNREGLIENRAFLDLRELVKALVLFLENACWQEDRDLIENRRKEKRQTVARPAVEKFGSELKELQTSTGLTQTAIEQVSQALQKGNVDPVALTALSDSIAQLRTTIPAVEITAQNTEEKLDQTVSDLEDERDLLLSLAGLGLAAERFTHEFARLTREASDLIARIQGYSIPPKIKADLDALSAVVDALRNDIRALGPMFYVRRATREKELSIKGAIANARLLNQGAFADAKVDFTVNGEDFTVFMREGPLTQVFNNLFDNAAFWLSRKSEEKNRKLKVVLDAVQREVVVADNGPGINPRYYGRVFQPFFSTKTDGRGLGLYIVREILAEKNFRVQLLEADEERIGKFPIGAAFLLLFPKPIEGEDHE